MKIKTSELTTPALDWAVATALGEKAIISRGYARTADGLWPYEYEYSSNWTTAGPIIERLFATEGFKLNQDSPGTVGREICSASNGRVAGYGPTPLIAAMRCFVASRLGDEVDVPDESL